MTCANLQQQDDTRRATWFGNFTVQYRGTTHGPLDISTCANESRGPSMDDTTCGRRCHVQYWPIFAASWRDCRWRSGRPASPSTSGPSVGRSVETNEAWAMTRRHVATQARAIRLITAVTWPQDFTHARCVRDDDKYSDAVWRHHGTVSYV